MGVIVRANRETAEGYTIAGLANRKDSQPASTAEEVANPELLAQILTALRLDLGAVRVDARGRWIEYEDLILPASGTAVTLPHGLDGRVRYWLTEVIDDGSGTQPKLSKDLANTTDNVLALKSYAAVTATVRIEKVQS